MVGDWTVSNYSGEFSPDTKQNLRDLYSNRCVVCRQRRKSPFGRPETQAAHVHPARHGGPDTESNGLLLCRRCHWGFDNGWLSLQRDHQIVVRGAGSIPGYEYFHQFRDRSLTAPDTDDLGPAVRFIEVHRKLFGFDPIDEGDQLTFGGLQGGETSLVDGRRVRIEGAPDEALAVNCRVTDSGSQRVRCVHHRTLATRTDTHVDRPDSTFDDMSDLSFEQLANWVRKIKDEYSGVEQKWEWGRLFRRARAYFGLSREETAGRIDVAGTSSLQIERSEGIYEMFPERDYEQDGPSYSAIAELQRKFNSPEDVRAAYDCIIAAGHPLTVKETRVWVELLMADIEVTRQIVRDEVCTHEELLSRGPNESIQRILDVHDRYESAYSRG